MSYTEHIASEGHRNNYYGEVDNEDAVAFVYKLDQMFNTMAEEVRLAYPVEESVELRSVEEVGEGVGEVAMKIEEDMEMEDEEQVYEPSAGPQFEVQESEIDKILSHHGSPKERETSEQLEISGIVNERSGQSS